MPKINFITSNSGKRNTLQSTFNSLGITADVVATNLDIMEPQFDEVKEISKFKALEAYKILGEPVLVEDGGMSINALNGFPGPYTKYALTTIGVEGLFNLMKDKSNRSAIFISVATYIDKEGNVHQFEREGFGFEISDKIVEIDSPYAWSEFWKIIYFKDFNKTLCEFSKEELDEYFKASGKNGSLQKFAKWYKDNQ